jgi:hypothetical protein
MRFPRFDVCQCACASKFELKESERDELLALEAKLVSLVTELDGSEDEDSVPARPDPKLFPSDDTALELESLVHEMGMFHWASVRGLYQLAEYYKSIAIYPKAIALTRMRIDCRRRFIHMGNPPSSSGLAWALEELGDLLMLHVSGCVVAGVSEEARERFCHNWNPRSQEDIETLKSCGVVEAYEEALEILSNLFGAEHEHAITAREKLAAVRNKIDRKI